MGDLLGVEDGAVDGPALPRKDSSNTLGIDSVELATPSGIAGAWAGARGSSHAASRAEVAGIRVPSVGPSRRGSRASRAVPGSDSSSSDHSLVRTGAEEDGTDVDARSGSSGGSGKRSITSGSSRQSRRSSGSRGGRARRARDPRLRKGGSSSRSSSAGGKRRGSRQSRVITGGSGTTVGGSSGAGRGDGSSSEDARHESAVRATKDERQDELSRLVYIKYFRVGEIRLRMEVAGYVVRIDDRAKVRPLVLQRQCLSVPQLGALVQQHFNF